MSVAKAADVAPNSGRTVMVGDREIALFHVDDGFYALDNTCPHQGGPLAEGYIDGRTVTCPWHSWTFKLDDGKMTLGDFACVDAFEVRVEDGDVKVARKPRSGEGVG